MLPRVIVHCRVLLLLGTFKMLFLFLCFVTALKFRGSSFSSIVSGKEMYKLLQSNFPLSCWNVSMLPVKLRKNQLTLTMCRTSKQVPIILRINNSYTSSDKDFHHFLLARSLMDYISSCVSQRKPEHHDFLWNFPPSVAKTYLKHLQVVGCQIISNQSIKKKKLRGHRALKGHMFYFF